MKRGTFKKKAVNPMKRTQLQAKTPLKRARHPLVASKTKKTVKSTKTVKKGYQVPKWFKSLPTGSHGNTPAQKKLWKVISDYVRERDWTKYGYCVSCKTKILDWRDGDAAHFKRYSVCNSYFKFHPDNIALSCKNCNRNDDGVVGHAFGEELIKRYGKRHLLWIEEENLKFRGVKIDDEQCVDKVAQLRPDLVI